MKKRFTGMMSFFVALTLAVSIMPASLVSAAKVFKTEEIAEVEDAFSIRGSLKYETLEYASGGVCAILKGDDLAADKITVSDFDMDFNIEKKGVYSVYVRVMFPDTNKDKFYSTWDYGNWTTAELGSTKNKFKWIQVGESRLSAGQHKLSIAHGESGGYYDAVYVCPRGVFPPDEIEGVQDGTIVTGYTFLNNQKEVPVMGSSYIFEAEDATVASPFVIKSGKGSSGSAISPTKQKSPDRDVPPAEGTPGRVQFRVRAEETASYSIWLRIRIPSRSNQLIYWSFNHGSYNKVTLPITTNWGWFYLTSREIKAGEDAVLEFYERYKDLEIDSVLFTTGGYTPHGPDGVPVEGSDDIMGELDQEAFTMPEVMPPAFEHPRVLFTKEDIPKILENLEAAQNEEPVRRYKEYLASEYDGTANGREYYQLPTLEAKAFDYALTGNMENGRKAVEGIMKFLGEYSLDDSNEETRDGGNIVFIASEIYDWCYPITNFKEKDFIIEKCIKLLSGIEIEWPPRDMGTINGHGCEAMFLKDILGFAIATYDERPDIWNNVGGKFYQEYVPVREWFNRSGYHHQGTSYGLYRHRWDTWAYLLITGMGAPEPYSGKDLAEMSYQIIYQRRPDGQYFRNGDTHQDSREKMWDYWSEHEEVAGLDQTVINDPYIKNELFRQNPFLESFDSDYSEAASPITYLINNDPNTEAKSYSGLPQSRYFGSPVGLTVARTGWNDGVESPDAIAVMNVGEWRTNNHQHANSGFFQLYYKGILAGRSGIYQGYTTKGSNNGSTQYSSEHVWMYASKSIAYNTMLIYDPSEPGKVAERGNVSDGGQRAIHNNGEISTLTKFFEADTEGHDTNTGTVVAQEIDPKDPIKPAYTYLKGDITKAYKKSKCEHYDRSFMFLNLFNEEVPATLIVYDRVTSTDPNFKKTWLLHTQEQPVIEDKKIVAERTLSSSVYDMGYNGKLTVDSLLPKNSTISVVGSEEEGWHTINGVDWTGLPSANQTTEGISYRVEISPEAPAKTDHFLNVLQVTDAGTTNYLPAEHIDIGEIHGVKVSDRVVTFARGNEDLSAVDFEINGEGTYKYTICDVVPGTWEVIVNGEIQKVFVTKEGKVLAFDAPAGKVSAKKVSDDTIEAIDVNDLRVETEREISVRIDGFFVYSKEKPVIENGTLMIPASLLKKYFALREATEGTSNIFSNHIASVTIPAEGDIGYITKADSKSEIRIIRKNGEIMIPARAVVEALGAAIEWDNLAKTAFITPPPKDYTKPEGYADIKTLRRDIGLNDAEADNIIELAVDEDVNTHWGAKGVGRYMDFEFTKEVMLENTEIVFNPNNGRNARFEIQVSLDGKTWKTVFTGKGDGSVEAGSWEKFEFEAPVAARWVRYVANGSNISSWNGVKEIRFKEVQ